MSLPASGLKSKPSKKPAQSRKEAESDCCLLHADFLLILLFNLEDGSNM
jgi:hypothetical protein